MYIAEGLKKGEQDLDEDEFLYVEKVPFDEVVRMILEGEITDGKTQAAVLKTKLLRGL
jgi:ADP-ribose pyrophosphatase